MYACTDIGCCGSTIMPYPTLKSSHDHDDDDEDDDDDEGNDNDNDENVDDWYEARHKLRRASYRSAHVRAYVSRLIFEERDFMTIFIRGLRGGRVQEETGRKMTALELTGVPRVRSRRRRRYTLILMPIRFIPDGNRQREYSAHLRNISASSWFHYPTRRNRADVRLNDSFVELVCSLFLCVHDRRRDARRNFASDFYVPRWKLVRNSPARQRNFALSA